MKLTTVVIAAAALAGAAGAASTASASAIVLEGYIYTASNDTTFWQVQDTGAVPFSDVVIGGTDVGAVGAGATSAAFLPGDCESCSTGAFSELVTVTIAGGGTFSGTFADVMGDIDANVAPASVGTVSVPEPAMWALMLAGFGGLGAALRMRRKAPIPA
jgi:hypothetical protein